MFRHPDSTVEQKKESASSADRSISPADKSAAAKPEVKKEYSNRELGELMEKNLKWSQIIYEQNRKINGKLLWSALAGWLRILIIAAIVFWSFWYALPLAKNLIASYGDILGGGGIGLLTGTGKDKSSPQSLEQILNLLPLNPAQKEQIKATLK